MKEVNNVGKGEQRRMVSKKREKKRELKIRKITF